MLSLWHILMFILLDAGQKLALVKLLENGCSSNARSFNGSTPLHIAGTAASIANSNYSFKIVSLYSLL